jgi:hypothetical protein
MLRHWAPGRSLTIELAASGARKPTLFLPTGSAVRKIGESGRDEPFNEAKRAMVSRGTTGTNLAVDTFSRRGHPIGSRQPMNHLRYVVVRREGEWNIVQGGHRYADAYPSKRQALCAAITFAEREGQSGRRVEVLVGHEDGHFLTEWIFGQGSEADAAAGPVLTPNPR